jgi:hypothetical protein
MKAFDTVLRHKLRDKMINNGYPEHLIRTEDTTICTDTGSSVSSGLEITNQDGKQGFPMSQIFFSIFINTAT